MYKKQLGFQKIVCLLAIIVAAIWFVYCLGMITDIHDALRFTMRNSKDFTKSKVAGSILYYDMQPFNTQFQTVSIVLILLGAFLFVTNTHSRRKYYIANYVATGAYSIATIATVIWTHINISNFAWRYINEVDFEALKKESEIFSNIVYTESTFLLDLHYVIGGLALIVVAMLIGNMIWKIRLMRGEDALLKAGKEVAA